MQKLVYLSFSLLSLIPASLLAQGNAPVGVGSIYIYRVKNGFGGPYKPSVFDNQRELFRMRNGYYTMIHVPPGMHTITSTLSGSGVALDVKAGETYYISVSMAVPSAFSSYKGEVTQVSAEQGKYAISQLRMAEPKESK